MKSRVGLVIFIIFMCCISSSVSAYVGYEYTQGNLGGEAQKNKEKMEKMNELKKTLQDAIDYEECDDDLYLKTKDKKYTDFNLDKDYEFKFNQFNKLCKYEGYKDIGALSESGFYEFKSKWSQENQ